MRLCTPVPAVLGERGTVPLAACRFVPRSPRPHQRLHTSPLHPPTPGRRERGEKKQEATRNPSRSWTGLTAGRVNLANQRRLDPPRGEHLTANQASAGRPGPQPRPTVPAPGALVAALTSLMLGQRPADALHALDPTGLDSTCRR